MITLQKGEGVFLKCYPGLSEVRNTRYAMAEGGQLTSMSHGFPRQDSWLVYCGGTEKRFICPVTARPGMVQRQARNGPGTDQE